MEIKTSTEQGILIIEIIGNIIDPEGKMILRNTVIKAANDGRHNVLINMKEVNVADSAGIGELVSAYTTLTNKGGQLKLLYVPPKVKDILTITKLITLFSIYDDHQAAIDSF